MKTVRFAILALAVLLVLHANAFAADPPNEAHFHHVHLNVTDPAATIDFYKRHLGAVDISYRGKVDALFTERSYILLNKVDEPPRSAPTTALMHIGWAGVDGPNEYEWLKKQGVEFQTPVTPLGSNYYMYFYGNDGELIEIYTGSKNHRFEHMHIWATDPNVTAQWLLDNIGIQGSTQHRPKPENINGRWARSCRVDNVNFIIYGKPDKGSSRRPATMPDEFEPTKGSAIDHLAFSYRNIGPVYERMKTAGVEIVESITRKEEGHDSFYVMAPDKLLIEIVEDKPVPEGSWE